MARVGGSKNVNWDSYKYVRAASSVDSFFVRSNTCIGKTLIQASKAE